MLFQSISNSGGRVDSGINVLGAVARGRNGCGAVDDVDDLGMERRVAFETVERSVLF